jgi:hypothetical protein
MFFLATAHYRHRWARFYAVFGRRLLWRDRSGGRLFGRCPAWRWAGHGRGAVRSPRGRAALARPLCARPGPPDLPGEDPVPGRWVKNRTERHLAPGSCGGRRAWRPALLNGPAGILIFSRCHIRLQMPRVPGRTRDVTIVPQVTTTRRAGAGSVRRLSPGAGVRAWRARTEHGRGACVKQRPPAASGPAPARRGGQGDGGNPRVVRGARRTAAFSLTQGLPGPSPGLPGRR